MPPLESADHWNDAVYWKAVNVDPYGKLVVASPVGLKVRWETVYKEMIAIDGKTVSATHIVHVSQDIELGSIFWEGKLTDLPTDPNNLYEVIHYERTPSLGNKYINRAAFLRRFRDSLPTVI